MVSFSDTHRRHQGNSSDKWAHYLKVYDVALAPYQQQAINLLEVGVFNGGSLDVWASYFPNAEKIIGCDINPKCREIAFANERIALVLGDAKQEATLQQIQALAPEFDIIIDDGSHSSGDIIATFVRLFPTLKMGGLYVIEDLCCGYWHGFEGGLNRIDSSMQFLKKLADVVNFEHWDVNASYAEFFAEFPAAQGIEHVGLQSVHSVQFSNSLCLIRKMPASENILGARCVVGDVFTVNDAVQHLNGSFIAPPVKQATPLEGNSVLQLQAQIQEQQKMLMQQKVAIMHLEQQIQALKRAS